MRRLLAAAALAVLVGACEPEYPAAAAHGEPEHGAEAAHAEESHGADPTSISGRVKDSAEATIHHPGADGNAGRPADGPGATATATADTAHAPPADDHSGH